MSNRPLSTRPYGATVIVIAAVLSFALVVPVVWLGGRYLLGIFAGYVLAGIAEWRASRVR